MPTTKRPPKAELIQMYSKEGLTDRRIAERLKVNTSTVYRWRQHYKISIKVEKTYRARLKRAGE